jgi:hypothetical protein
MDAPTPTPMVIGTSTPTPASSVAASCYPSPPIDSSIGIEESIDVESDSEELEADTKGLDVLVVVDDHHSLRTKEKEMLGKHP